MSSITLGRPLGFEFRVDPNALVVLGLYALMGARAGAGGVLTGVLLAAVVFGSILVHELGHAITARAFGLGPVSITLHGFGGLTQYRRGASGLQGILVTAAGPLAGFALGTVSLVLGLVALGVLGPGLVTTVFDQLVWVNFFWSAFNLLPMYPMDGGVITLHALSFRLPSGVALVWTARLGIAVAVLVALAAFSSGFPFVGIVAGMSGFQCWPYATRRV